MKSPYALLIDCLTMNLWNSRYSNLMYLKKVLNKKVFELYSNADVGFEDISKQSSKKSHLAKKSGNSFAPFHISFQNQILVYIREV